MSPFPPNDIITVVQRSGRGLCVTCPDLRTGRQTWSRVNLSWASGDGKDTKYVGVHVARDSRQPWGQSRWREAFSAARARLCLECKHVRKVWESLCVHAGDRFLCFGSQGDNSWWWARLTLAGLRACRWLQMGVWNGRREKAKLWKLEAGKETPEPSFSKVKLRWTNGFSNKHLSKLTPPFSIRLGVKRDEDEALSRRVQGKNEQEWGRRPTPWKQHQLIRPHSAGPLYIKPIKTSITLTIYNYRTT